ncbi:DUF4166 domain-containing protein [Dongia rigui]|uniref:DUF4166 domain-containing protein n=1 Tax=Dongia rigui TaxID=940149 RepID=A0ABU5E3M9_9PROT|nr:DUF4166 domain-containing protein [Dongia rigui]MDY0873513.1 DUF4166 domain-containing protein [Dongia rigui]
MSLNALQLCLGADFAHLLPVVQQAHLGPIELRGHVSVTRGRGLGALLASVLNMPAANPQCFLIVSGDHLSDRMIWRRSFDGKKLESNFLLDGGHLIEMMGRLKLRLKPRVNAGRLHYELRSAYFGRIPLPRCLMPTLVAWEGEAEGFYEFEVEIRLPLIGRLVRYAGKLTLVSA